MFRTGTACLLVLLTLLTASGQSGKGDDATLDSINNELNAQQRQAQELAKQLASVQLNERRDAAYGLAQLGAAALPALDALIEGLSDRDEQVFVQSATAIARIGEPAAQAIPALIKSLSHSNAQRRYRAGWALSEIGEASVQPLVDAFDNEESNRRRLALAEALGWMTEQSPRVAPVLIESLQTTDREDLRQAAAESLARLEMPEALAKAIQSDDSVVQEIIARALAKLDSVPDSAHKRLVLLSEQGEPAVRVAAVAALASTDAPSDQLIRSIVRAALGTDPELRSEAVIALRKLKNPAPAIGFLAKALSSDDESERIAAASTLGLLGTQAESAIPALVDSLRRPSSASDATIRAVSRIGAAAVEPLLVAFESAQDADEDLSDGETMSQRLARALALIGGKATPRLISALDDESILVRANAAAVLAEMQPTPNEAIESLTPLLEHESAQLRAAAADALAGCTRLPEHVVSTLSDLRQDPSPLVRAKALDGIVRHQTDRSVIVPALLQAMKDSDAGVRSASMRALSQMESPPDESTEQIAACLSDDEASVRSEAAIALGRLGDVAKQFVDPIADLLDDKERQPRISALKSIGQIGTESKSIVMTISTFLDDGDTEFVLTALRTLEQLGGETSRDTTEDSSEVTARILPLLKHPNVSIRCAAVNCLSAVESESSKVVPRLIEALDDADWTVRRDAAIQLGEIGSPAATSAVPSLLRLSRNEQDRDAARSALRSIDDAGPESIPLLLEGLKGEDRGRLFYSIYLLGKIKPAAKEALPALKDFRDSTDSNRLKEMANRTIRTIESE